MSQENLQDHNGGEGESGERGRLFSLILEGAWEKLPELLERLPPLKRLEYFNMAREKCGLVPAFLSFARGGWGGLLETLAVSKQDSARTGTPGYDISLTQARVDILYEFYWRVLEDLGKISRSTGDVLSGSRWDFRGTEPFITALEGLVSFVPYRYGIDPDRINTETLRQAVATLKSL